MAVGEGDEYNRFACDAAKISGKTVAPGAAVVAMRSSAGICLSRIPEALWKDSGVGLGVRAPRLTRVLCVYGRHDRGVRGPDAGAGTVYALGGCAPTARYAAMWKYNFNEGIYAVREYELPLVLGLTALGVATTGAGPFSLDHLICRSKY